MVIEALPPIGNEQLHRALSELAGLLIKFRNCEIVIKVLDKDISETEIR
jgi:hypothetical protein